MRYLSTMEGNSRNVTQRHYLQIESVYDKIMVCHVGRISDKIREVDPEK